MFLLALQMEGWGHKPRREGGVQEQDKSSTWTLSHSVQKERSPADVLILTP